MFVVVREVLTRSLTLTGLELNVIPLQKLSARRATLPSRDIRMLSPWTWWKSNGGRLLVPPPLEFDLGAEIKEKLLISKLKLSFTLIASKLMRYQMLTI